MTREVWAFKFFHYYYFYYYMKTGNPEAGWTSRRIAPWGVPWAAQPGLLMGGQWACLHGHWVLGHQGLLLHMLGTRQVEGPTDAGHQLWCPHGQVTSPGV